MDNNYNRVDALETSGTEGFSKMTDNVEAVENIESAVLSPVDQWIQRSPDYRKNEIFYLRSMKLGFDFTITDSGDLRQPFVNSNWVFMLVLDRSFPNLTENNELPVKVYLVQPSLSELKKGYHIDPPYVKKDAGGSYLYFEKMKDELEAYRNRRNSRCMSETAVYYTYNWIKELSTMVSNKNRRNQNKGATTGFVFSFFSCEPFGFSSFPEVQVREKYSEGRSGYPDYSNYSNPKCNKVVLSDRAFIQIFNESQSRIETETGGLLLGHYVEGVWYVVEASDPGTKGVFNVAYHESDEQYQNHVCDVISRTYKNPLVFLGMWHRHPGSLDTFSGTDDQTNYKYAVATGNGCISAIINYDPDFRITFYYVECDAYRRVRYTRVDVEVGDDKIENKEIIALSDVDNIKKHMSRRGRR